jgi:transcriptional regulator with XRE-family HTH domain
MKSYLVSNLKYLRERENLSQQNVADELEMKRGTYSKYEDDVNVPTVITLLKLKEFYELESIDELVFHNLKKKLTQ